MIKKFIFVIIALLSCNATFAQDNLSIVYIHIGPSFPKHLLESIRQVRLHNPNEDVYICGNAEALRKDKKHLSFLKVKGIPIETLPKSDQHISFLKRTSFTEDFWIRTTERLLIAHELIKQQNLENVFHIESDVMIYDSFRDMLPIFTQLYPSMAIPFANDYAAICSLVFLKDEKAASLMADCIDRHAPEGQNDMRLPGILKEEMGTSVIDHLPILPPSYVENTDQKDFVSKWAPKTDNKFDYCKHFESFSCIFDAVTFGTLLSRKDGSFCEGTIFDPRGFNIIWKKNNHNLYVPYVQYNGFECRICNLHIHAKNLQDFRSDKRSPPLAWVNRTFVNN